MTNKISSQISDTKAELLKALRSFRADEFNSVPFEGSWTPAQVGRHVQKSLTGMQMLLEGPEKETTREPDQKIAALRNVFLDFNLKMESPDFIIPENKTFDQDRLMNDLENTLMRITELVETRDLSKTCKDFEFPTFGDLTKLEVCHFIVFHTQRHIHQLKKMTAMTT